MPPMFMAGVIVFFASHDAFAIRCLSCSFSAVRMYAFRLLSGSSFHSRLTHLDVSVKSMSGCSFFKRARSSSAKIRYAVRGRFGFPSSRPFPFFPFFPPLALAYTGGTYLSFCSWYTLLHSSASALHSAKTSVCTFFHMSASRVVTCCISSLVNFVVGSECTSFMIRFRYRSQKMRYAVRARLGFSPTPSTMILARLFFLLLFERRIKPGPNATFAASYSSFRRSASALHAASSSGATFFHRSASRVVTCCISSRVNFASGSGCTSRMICARCLSQKTRYAVLARFGGCGRSFPFSSLSLLCFVMARERAGVG
mmetsp:Transcript_6675/g.24577  ORF Transcript_6675/g.24577 Transcript_6675/m.24577 type:complete len:313 (+) Transcript_6675:603-1541(+)